MANQSFNQIHKKEKTIVLYLNISLHQPSQIQDDYIL